MADDGEELDEALRTRVQSLFDRLDTLDHYEVLGVGRDADRKALKSAYYDLAAVFHPDRYFRKNLGVFKSKMEVCFARITQAHDVLTSKKRAGYDAYLADAALARGVEVAEAQAARLAATVRDAAAQAPTSLSPNGDDDLERLEALFNEAMVTVERSERPSEKAPAPAPTPTPAQPGPHPIGPATAAQRQAFARRLLGGAGRPVSASTSTPTSNAPPLRPPPSSSGKVSLAAAEAMESLRRRYAERLASARSARAKAFSASAERALRDNDPVSASNSYRLAMSLCPDDEALRVAFHRAQKLADGVLGEMYVRQAQYEEENFNYAAAASSWAKAAKARPGDARARAHAARTLVECAGASVEALGFARGAVALEPNNGDFRILNAQLLIQLRRAPEAEIELDAASRLMAGDPRIETLRKLARKGS